MIQELLLEPSIPKMSFGPIGFGLSAQKHFQEYSDSDNPFGAKA